jgi:membrane protease subunit (stomatin/prohibitin family)
LLQVADPARLVTNLTATVDVTDNERIAGRVSDQLLKVLRTHVTTQISRNGCPILGLMAYSAEIEQNTIEAGNGQLAPYGIRLTRMGNFDINLSPEDEQQVKELAQATSYSQLAGGFQTYAAGEMALGAAQGMAQGSGGTEDVFLGADFGLASAFGAQQAQARQGQQQQNAPSAPQQPSSGQQGSGAAPAPTAAAPPVAGGAVCASCQTANPAGAKFCMGCGQAWRPLSRTARSAAPSSRPAPGSAGTAAPGQPAER